MYVLLCEKKSKKKDARTKVRLVFWLNQTSVHDLDTIVDAAERRDGPIIFYIYYATVYSISISSVRGLVFSLFSSCSLFNRAKVELLK